MAYNKIKRQYGSSTNSRKRNVPAKPSYTNRSSVPKLNAEQKIKILEIIVYILKRIHQFTMSMTKRIDDIFRMSMRP